VKTPISTIFLAGVSLTIICSRGMLEGGEHIPDRCISIVFWAACPNMSQIFSMRDVLAAFSYHIKCLQTALMYSSPEARVHALAKCIF